MTSLARSAALSLLALAISTHVPFAAGQVLQLDRMPIAQVNTPGGDLFSLTRPALSVGGFESANTDQALGLREILLLRYEDADPLVVPVFDRLIELAAMEQSNPLAVPRENRWSVLDRNTAILQSRAFEALVTFVLELNGYDDADLAALGLRPHPQAAAALRQALVAPPGGILIRGDQIIVDPMRHARAISNVARGLDLYLALENAYAQFPGEADPALLLSPAEKGAVMLEAVVALLTMDGLLEFFAIDAYADEIDLPPLEKAALLALIRSLPAGSRTVEEVEPGNWSMKLRLALGYAALSIQLPPSLPEANAVRALFDKAVQSGRGGNPSQTDRTRHWNFMTHGGARFWAEGPYYFDFALEQVIPFWHAARINQLVDEDPFFASWFTEPLTWLADLVAPDGTLVPIDDGNRTPMRFAGLMRWAGGYGDAALGQQYAWIEGRLEGPARRTETLLVELAIPRTQVEQAPAERVGSDPGPLIPHQTEQQLVLRHATAGGATDFLYLNGEHGMAVERGEGHEQPDQLQLLYYRDDVSYLMDSGYDRGFTVANSSWNHYYDHNVMTVGTGEGGLEPPALDLLDVRKRSDAASTGEVEALHLSRHGELTLLHGEQPLSADVGPGYRADYTRDVLYVPGDRPYVVDLNQVQHETPPQDCRANRFDLRYHVNSALAERLPTLSGDEGEGVRWEAIGGAAGRRLEIHPTSVEFDLGDEAAGLHVLLEEDDVLEAETASGKLAQEIRRLRLTTADRCDPHWTVFSVIQALDAGAPTSRPVALWRYEDAMPVQGWVWDVGQGSNLVADLFVARSAGTLAAPILVRPRQAGIEWPKLQFVLAPEHRFGFVRLVQRSSGWELDPDFVLGLDALGPEEIITWLIGDVNAAAVQGGIKTALIAKLVQARQRIAAGDGKSASNLLNAFVRHLEAQAGKAVSVELAEEWSERAAEVIDMLLGPTEGESVAPPVALDAEVPDAFALHANYPNPFNPATQIRFDLPEAGFVRIQVYDAQGREVARLMEGTMEAGRHTVTWEAEGLASGVYFCRLSVGAFSATRTMFFAK